jgi:hypothetical protein
MFQLKLLHATKLQSNYIHAAEGTLAFHCVKYHNSYEAMHCKSGLKKHIFMTWKQTRNFQVSAENLSTY